MNGHEYKIPIGRNSLARTFQLSLNENEMNTLYALIINATQKPCNLPKDHHIHSMSYLVDTLLFPK